MHRAEAGEFLAIVKTKDIVPRKASSTIKLAPPVSSLADEMPKQASIVAPAAGMKEARTWFLEGSSRRIRATKGKIAFLWCIGCLKITV